MRRALVVHVALLVASEVCSQPLETSEDFQRAIRTTAPERVARQLGESGAYDRLLAGVESGNESWLAIAGALRPHFDAGRASELEVALIAALSKEPEAVVYFLSQYAGPKSTFRIVSICGDGSLQEPKQHYAVLLEKLRAVKAPRAPATLRQCILAAAAALRQAPQ